MTDLQCDVVLVGGGIVGLWSLARLRAAGYSAVLVERSALGEGQTIWSQGIIHGGIKYALGGEATAASKAIAGMPAIWARCLEGEGEFDLSAVRPYAPGQYLWTTPGLISRLAGMAASVAIRTSVQRVEASERPPALRDAPRGVDIYRVAEPVLPIRLVLGAMSEQLEGAMARVEELSGVRVDEQGVRLVVRSDQRAVSMRAQRLVLTAGAGNADLALMAGLEPHTAPMQRRPLHMAVARGTLPELAGHCLGSSSLPRLTITSYSGPLDGPERTWLIGGSIAEEGVSRDAPAQAAAVRRELRACLPWLSLDSVRIACGRIDRAEGLTPGGHRPDEPVIAHHGPVSVAWPTKLAFAPLCAQRLVEQFHAQGLKPQRADLAGLDALPHPEVAEFPWDRAGVAWHA
jgi:glycine/D-amino acid oxidase-like deaminating enzyme